jgi:hypothetical protein
MIDVSRFRNRPLVPSYAQKRRADCVWNRTEFPRMCGLEEVLRRSVTKLNYKLQENDDLISINNMDSHLTGLCS